jgi:hypothetical protein
MGSMFDHAHYVPVLRWKAGERGALKALRLVDKAAMTPLLEPLPGYMRPRRARGSGSAPDDLSVLVEQVADCWGSAPVFIDASRSQAVPYEGSKAGNVERLFAGLAAGGVAAVPVTRPDQATEFQEAIRRAIEETGKGVAVRVPVASLRTPTAGYELLELLECLGVEPAGADLIVEYGLVGAADPSLTFVCLRLPEINRWRTFTTLGGSFPPNLMEFRRPGQYQVEREEWRRWSVELADSADLPRRPTFGDYRIQHPRYEEPVKGANPSASIRYTSDTYWVVMRGEGLRTQGSPGYPQYQANAELLCGRKEFRGPNFSAGDAYIWGIGSGADPRTGSPATWLQAGINHHLTFVVRQIPIVLASSV